MACRYLYVLTQKKEKKGDGIMNKKEVYSHENYREILKEARIYDGTNENYFCTDCRRYVPKKEAGEPCIFCGSTHWNIKNPLIQNIINTDALSQYMYETFRHCIEPFVAFDKLEWKNGNIFYKRYDTKHLINDDKKHFLKEIEMWCVSHYISDCFLSICVRWTTILKNSNDKPIELTFLRFFTFSSPDEVSSEYNDEKDDEFYFNLIYNELSKDIECKVTKVEFKALDENDKEFDVTAPIHVCSDKMFLADDKLLGGLSTDNLLNHGLTNLCMALSDFTLIPNYWGCHD